MGMSGRSGKIDEELVCIDSMVQRLKEIDSNQAITIRRECNDPPDFWINIAGTKYAAEVTSVVADENYAALCRALLRSIQVQAKSKASDAVKGTYALVAMRRPDVPRKRTNSWSQLVSTAVKNIQAMSNSSTGVRASLLRTKSGDLSLVKLADSGDTIGLCRTPEAKWEGEVRSELSQHFQKAINEKRAKIEKKGVTDKRSDVLLLFYDAYGYADAEDARQAFQTVEGYEWFHSVFWAASFSDRQNTIYPDNPGRSGVFLYSKNLGWR